MLANFTLQYSAQCHLPFPAGNTEVSSRPFVVGFNSSTMNQNTIQTRVYEGLGSLLLLAFAELLSLLVFIVADTPSDSSYYAMYLVTARETWTCSATASLSFIHHLRTAIRYATSLLEHAWSHQHTVHASHRQVSSLNILWMIIQWSYRLSSPSRVRR